MEVLYMKETLAKVWIYIQIQVRLTHAHMEGARTKRLQGRSENYKGKLELTTGEYIFLLPLGSNKGLCLPPDAPSPRQTLHGQDDVLQRPGLEPCNRW